MKNFKLLIFDLFFVVSSIIGVGFATGKEIAHFFLSGRSLFWAVVIFFFVFVGLTWYIMHVKSKHNLNELTNLNKFAFGKYYEIGNIILVILFIVTNAAMLAGCDNLVGNYLCINLPIVSLFLSGITFFIALSGVDKIKAIANVVMPVLIVIIAVNACCNLKTPTLQGSAVKDIAYPIIFCAENFITLIAVLINTKSKPVTLSLLSGLTISLVILISAIAIGNLRVDMPMLTLSKNIGVVFFSVYLIGVIFALFTTLQISTYNCLQVINKNPKQRIFTLILILFISQIIAYLGFNFIVQYLYSAIGVLGAIYLIVLVVNLVIASNIRK